MKQQYQILRKENDWLLDYVGKDFNKEILQKVGAQLNKEHGKFAFPGIAKAIVTVNNKYGEILRIGASSLLKELKTGKIIPDITINNYGTAFAALFAKAPGNSSRVGNLTPEVGGNNNLDFYQPQTFAQDAFNRDNTAGGFIHGQEFQVGSGTTAPTQTDRVIETAFGSAPEDGKISAAALYDSVLRQTLVTSFIVAGGAGTINEIGYFAIWLEQIATSNIRYMLFHDAISPGVPFVAAQTITVTYIFQL